MRPYWKGYLKLALVSCPIALHAACSSAERVAFRQINKATGDRLRQQLIDEETREWVAPEHKGRGYEVAKGQYLIIEDAVGNFPLSVVLPAQNSENSKANRIETMKGPAESGQICSVGRRKIAKKIAKNKRCYANTLRPCSRMLLKVMKGG